MEQDRVEYKKGWNPSDIIHTICAFANDFTNTNGGYIVIGIEERNGRPLLPPAGIDADVLDSVQKELFQYCNLIEPRYIPQLEIVECRERYVVYLWCSAGDDGPYMAPKEVYSRNRSDKHKEYWIKPSSVKTIAKGAELSELFSKFNTVPFDDRVNREAKISDIRRGFVEDFLVESDSSLVAEMNDRPLEDLLVAMEVANVTDVGVDIRNVGILMFSEHPEKFLPGAQIELIRFYSSEAEGSDDFTEKIFTGSLQKQIRDALSYIQATLIEEKVVKKPDKAEAERFFNYPYAALEESLVNAVFHKSYRIQEPVEIRIYVNCIKIINYPGPEKWIDMEQFKSGKAIARRYRNRRIGEFLKEIDLSEKKSTGITKILRALKVNHSPLPDFETDDGRNYLITTIKIHPAFEVRGVSVPVVNERSLSEVLSEVEMEKMAPIIGYLRENGSVTPKEAMAVTRKSAATARRYLALLCGKGILTMQGNTNAVSYSLRELKREPKRESKKQSH
ncbi:MAG: putative DNA binding domain-containing protein [Synergistaceae bacterium]|nr:putative DNA binding domain-containing protein [Synergistaceae bacterium]